MRLNQLDKTYSQLGRRLYSAGQAFLRAMLDLLVLEDHELGGGLTSGWLGRFYLAEMRLLWIKMGRFTPSEWSRPRPP